MRRALRVALITGLAAWIGYCAAVALFIAVAAAVPQSRVWSSFYTHQENFALAVAFAAGATALLVFVVRWNPGKPASAEPPLPSAPGHKATSARAPRTSAEQAEWTR